MDLKRLQRDLTSGIESKPQQQNSRGGGLIGVLDSVSNALRGVNDKKKK